MELRVSEGVCHWIWVSMERVDGWARHHCVAGAREVDLTGAGLFPQVAEDVADVVVLTDSDSDLQAHSLGGSAAKAHIWSCLIRTRPWTP